MSRKNMELPNLAESVGKRSFSPTVSAMYVAVNKTLKDAYKKAIITNDMNSFVELFGAFPYLFDDDIHEDRDVDTELHELIYKHKRFVMFNHIIVYSLYREVAMFFFDLIMTLENQSIYKGNAPTGWREFLIMDPLKFLISNCFVPELELFKAIFTEDDIPEDKDGKVYYTKFLELLDEATKTK